VRFDECVQDGYCWWDGWLSLRWGVVVFTRCIFCHKSFPPNGVFGRLPPGRRLAFDPKRGRLWVVCESCHRWNLCPIEERWEALHQLERMVRDRSQLVAETDNIALLNTGELFLIRVGTAGLAEQSWWRYGRELHARRSSFFSTRSQIAAYTFGAMQYLGELVGLGDEDLSITWDDTPAADILRWRRFGWAAWHGQLDCRYCHSTLRALRYDISWWVFPQVDDRGRMSVQVPCPRCDPWTPDNVYTIEGPESENVLRRVLAYQHIMGAPEATIRDAARVIEEVGGTEPHSLEKLVTGYGKKSLWGMGKTRSIALEIAINESVEHRMMTQELQALEFMWRREEQLARIIDEELTPKDILDQHERRLPVEVLAREKLPRDQG
jgi:hypothetical protein